MAPVRSWLPIREGQPSREFARRPDYREAVERLPADRRLMLTGRVETTPWDSGLSPAMVSANVAAMAEYLARRDGWTVPAWARLPEREAWPWWFVTDLRGLHPQALVESPSSFRRRGVFITSGALERA